MARKTIWVAVVVALLGAVPAAAEQEGHTLKERIKSVSNKLYIKSGRFELTVLPMTSISLNDAFYQKFGGGLGLTYHFTEGLALGLLATYSLDVATSNAELFGSEERDLLAGKRNFLVGLDLMWAPLYGKVNLASEWVMHFDTYLIGGVAGVGVVAGKPDDTGDLTKLVEEQKFGFAVDFGLGVRFFISRMFAIRVELKDYMVFNDTVAFSNQERSDFQHQLLVNLGLSMFFGQGDGED